MDRTFDRVVSVGVVVGATAATMATATIWLLLTNPVGIASAMVDRNTVALLQQIAGAPTMPSSRSSSTSNHRQIQP